MPGYSPVAWTSAFSSVVLWALSLAWFWLEVPSIWSNASQAKLESYEWWFQTGTVYGRAALETESFKGWIKAVLGQLAWMSGNNSVVFCLLIQIQPVSVTSEQRTTINRHGKELGFGAERHDVTPLSCEALPQWHRDDIYLSNQVKTCMKDLSQILF